MREIEFRGKSLESNRWIYGCYCLYRDYRDAEQNLIYNRNNGNSEWVDKLTVGQYTGLTDKNGTKIFEGDILIGDIPELIVSQNLIGIVEYQESAFVVKFTNRKSWQIQKVGFCSFVNYKVIGNIYDNPELLGENNG